MKLTWEETSAVADLVTAIEFGDKVRANEALDRLADGRSELRERVAVTRSHLRRRGAQ